MDDWLLHDYRAVAGFLEPLLQIHSDLLVWNAHVCGYCFVASVDGCFPYLFRLYLFVAQNFYGCRDPGLHYCVDGQASYCGCFCNFCCFVVDLFLFSASSVLKKADSQAIKVAIMPGSFFSATTGAGAADLGAIKPDRAGCSFCGCSGVLVTLTAGVVSTGSLTSLKLNSSVASSLRKRTTS